ncbi:23S rRNA pseudouridines 1911, 1915, 1917 synthase [Syntrophotalea carbinolica DSM 2380]|uniref:Pseudouridine synthase n=1 Tax=Syntrophotalea carbinolica (strain DSM 2380 / NBRC 103641 / GraBd1) TaxID=338963 RepID=Q3A0C2_SYNC1|nr:RluA family pseudouridine synthase [Syntrophotalea carbinolica]ABA90185.1 23S rRNA pseudouridines 1911, 1915, 1917 synthase [Syntrophotalea carbinolica DSM 2380]
MGQLFTLCFGRERSPERLDRFLVEQLPELSRSQLKKLIDDGRVLLDGAAAKPGSKLKGGETLTVDVPDPSPAEAVSEDIPLVILYEDRHLIVIDKPPGMVVHPAPGHYQGTLVNALLHHCQDLSGIGGELRPGIVHRLDKDTSGVMVATKTDSAHQSLAAQFKAHSITRRYIALIHGVLTGDRGSIDRPIGRHPTHRKKMSTTCRTGRHAVTHWRVLRRFDDDRLTLVELALETGRTHQIRVHFSEQQHPLLGDPVYGGSGRLKTINDPQLLKRAKALGRQALHARLLGFQHPETGKYLEFSSPLPEDLRSVIDYLTEKYGQPPFV